MKIADLAQGDSKKNWFFWGTVLTWTLFIPLIIGLSNAFKGISEQKATGLDAIASGFAEAYVTLGVILAFVLSVGAIVLLVRSFSTEHPIRAVFSVLYICCCGLVVSLAGLSVWLFLRGPRF